MCTVVRALTIFMVRYISRLPWFAFANGKVLTCVGHWVQESTLMHRSSIISCTNLFGLFQTSGAPQNLSYSLHEAGVVTTGGIDSNPVRNFNRFLAHQSANVGSSHRCRYQRCATLYLRRSLCRRLRPVSARVRSLVVESYLSCGHCWLNTPLWLSNLSLDGRALVAASAQSAPSEVLIRFRSMPDIPTKLSLAWGLGGDGTP